MISKRKISPLMQWIIVFILGLASVTLFVNERNHNKAVAELIEFHLSLTAGDASEVKALSSQTQLILNNILSKGFSSGGDIKKPNADNIVSELDQSEIAEFSKSLQSEISSEQLSAQIFSYLKTFTILLLGILSVLFLSSSKQAIVLKENQELDEKVSFLRSELEKVEAEKTPFEKKYKAIKVALFKARKKEEELNTRIDEADLVEKELKDFVDIQIKTNEQLLIAETKLKNLLEKEQESKSIINQTLDRLKDAQGQLVHSEKMASLGQLTAGIAHEINNPINFIYNGISSLKRSLDELSTILDKYAELDSGADSKATIVQVVNLKKEFEYNDLREDLDELIVDIKEGAVRTIEIVKGLRVFSRLDEEERKEADINECLDATLVLLKNKMKNGISLVKEMDAELPKISCYPGQLNQVFMNILNNAIQAIPEDQEDAEIHVKTEKIGDNILIKLGDNGTGMTDEVKQRIFEPFFTTKPVGVGTGLGMSISYGIIEKHQGILNVNSELGKGTEFIISLPEKLEKEFVQQAVG